MRPENFVCLLAVSLIVSAHGGAVKAQDDPAQKLLAAG